MTTNLDTWMARVRERLSNTTPGPWRADFGNWQVEQEKSRDGVCTFYPDNRDKIDGETNPINPMYDAQLIANAPTDLAISLDVIEELRHSLELFEEIERKIRGVFPGMKIQQQDIMCFLLICGDSAREALSKCNNIT